MLEVERSQVTASWTLDRGVACSVWLPGGSVRAYIRSIMIRTQWHAQSSYAGDTFR